MPDIALRFHKDMLVLSAPLAAVLARARTDVHDTVCRAHRILVMLYHQN